MTRREFVRNLCEAAAASGLPLRLWGASAAQGPADLTIGLLSDIHISLGPKDDPVKATEVFRKALEYFRERHVDGVLISGDLANAGLETELKAVADAWFAVFPGGRLPDGSTVANLMHYGDHDTETRFYTDSLKARFEKAGVPVPRSLSVDELRREVWEACFHEPWQPMRHVRVKGYDFFLSNFMREGARSSPRDLAAQLRAANLAPDRPFFYSQHRYIGGTYRSDEEMWGGDDRTSAKVLPDFPNCVAFQGHTHYMVTDECGVWTGPFVTVNNGSLLNQAVGRCHENGVDISWVKTDPMRETQMPCVPIGQCHAGQVMTVRGNLITIERRDMVRGLPLGPDIVFSADPALRNRYGNASRKAASLPPAFPKDAVVTVAEMQGQDRRKRRTDQLVVTFPTAGSAAGRARAHDYLVGLTRPDGTALLERRVYSPGINLPESEDLKPATCVFARRDLPTDGAMRVTVTPRNCWGVAGKSISTLVNKKRSSRVNIRT